MSGLVTYATAYFSLYFLFVGALPRAAFPSTFSSPVIVGALPRTRPFRTLHCLGSLAGILPSQDAARSSYALNCSDLLQEDYRLAALLACTLLPDGQVDAGHGHLPFLDKHREAHTGEATCAVR